MSIDMGVVDYRGGDKVDIDGISSIMGMFMPDSKLHPDAFLLGCPTYAKRTER